MYVKLYTHKETKQAYKKLNTSQMLKKAIPQTYLFHLADVKLPTMVLDVNQRRNNSRRNNPKVTCSF